jgi:type I restriction enzyme S subunit
MKAGWNVVRLGSAVVQIDRSIPSESLGEVNLAGVYSFGRGLFRRGPMIPSETSYKTYNRLVEDDFVISQPKAWEGAIARVGKDFGDWYLSPVFPTFRCDPAKLLPGYLEFFCKCEPVWTRLLRDSRGIGARRETVSAATFLTLEIPLPHIAEQRRIVTRIEGLAAQIEDARRLRKEAVEEAEAMAHSLVESIFHRLGKKHGTRNLGDVCTTITDGDHNTPQFSAEGVRFIFVGNVSSGHLHFENSKRVSQDYFNSLKLHRLPKRGDILYSAVGATLGIPAVVDSEEPFCFQRHVAILKPDRQKVDSQFVWHMLGSRTVFDKAWASSTGSAQPTIPLRAIRELPIPTPHLPEQRQIVAELDALQAEVDALKRLQSETAAELDALLPAILDRAFKGEL